MLQAWPATRSELTGETNLCLAGGVALNCVANGRLLREGPFEDIWIQPAAGDAGGALGAALAGLAPWSTGRSPRHGRRAPRRHAAAPTSVPSFPTTRSRRSSTARAIPCAEARPERVGRSGSPRLIAEENVIGLVPGAHGVRPARARRALDHRRRALAEDAVDHEPQDQVPRVVPPVRAERAWRSGSRDYFELDRPSPYMLLVAPVRKDAAHAERRRRAASCRSASGSTRSRSDVPGHHPRGLLGARPDRRRGGQPALLRLISRRSRS